MPTNGDDILKISNLPGLEPEEQPVTREVEIPISVRGSQTSGILGQLKGQAEITTPALEFAQNLRRICTNCKHFDQAKARQIFEAKSETQEGQIEIRNLIGNLLGLAGTPDLSSVLDEFNSLGYCHAFSTVDREMIVHPLSNCPTEAKHLGFSDRFEPIDRSAIKRGDKAYDGIMKAAEGKEIT